MMRTGDARDLDHRGGILGWVCDRCNPRYDWRWVIDSNMRPWLGDLLLDLWSNRSILNIGYYWVKMQQPHGGVSSPAST